MLTIEKNRCIPLITPKTQSRPLAVQFWEMPGTVQGQSMGTIAFA